MGGNRAYLVILAKGHEGVDSHLAQTCFRLSPGKTRTYIILLAADGSGDRHSLTPKLRPWRAQRNRALRPPRRACASWTLRQWYHGSHRSRVPPTRSRLGGLPHISHAKVDDSGYWNELEKYISDHSDAEFSHAICPSCLAKYYPDVKDECL